DDDSSSLDVSAPHSDTTEIYTLSLHDALPILAWCFFDSGERVTYRDLRTQVNQLAAGLYAAGIGPGTHVGVMAPNIAAFPLTWRSEEHTSELQSRENLVCRLLLEKKKIVLQKH